MSTPPATGSFLFQGPSVSNTSRGPLFEQWLAFSQQLVGGGGRQTLAMSSGSITPGVALVTVDTQGGAASGNLDAIQQTNLPVGSVVLLCAASSARVVTVRHNQGSAPAKILLATGASLVLTSTTVTLALEATASGWSELWRWYGTDSASWRSFLALGAAAAFGSAALSDMQAGTSTTLAVTPSSFRAGVTDKGWFESLTSATAAVTTGNTLLIDDGTSLKRVGTGKVLSDLAAQRMLYTTGNLAVSAGAGATFTHGLGTTPRTVQATLICVADDGGYVAANGDTAVPASGVYLWSNGTTLGYNIDSSGNGGLQVYNFNSSHAVQLTYASWRLKISAFA